MGSDLLPICFWCKHVWLGSKRTKIRVQCEAFPSGIPREIIPVADNLATHDHRFPHPNDNGIQFEECFDEQELRRRHLINRFLNAGYTLEEVHQILETIFAAYNKRRQEGIMQPKYEEEEDNME